MGDLETWRRIGVLEATPMFVLETWRLGSYTNVRCQGPLRRSLRRPLFISRQALAAHLWEVGAASHVRGLNFQLDYCETPPTHVSFNVFAFAKCNSPTARHRPTIALAFFFLKYRTH